VVDFRTNLIAERSVISVKGHVGCSMHPCHVMPSASFSLPFPSLPFPSSSSRLRPP